MRFREHWAAKVLLLTLAVVGGGACGAGCGDWVGTYEFFTPTAFGGVGAIGVGFLLAILVLASRSLKAMAVFAGTCCIGVASFSFVSIPVRALWCRLGDGSNCAFLAERCIRDGDRDQALEYYRRACAGTDFDSHGYPSAEHGCVAWAGMDRSSAPAALAILERGPDFFERSLLLLYMTCRKPSLPEKDQRLCDRWSAGQVVNASCHNFVEPPRDLCVPNPDYKEPVGTTTGRATEAD